METVFFSDTWPIAAFTDCEKTPAPGASMLAPATKTQHGMNLYKVQVTTKPKFDSKVIVSLACRNYIIIHSLWLATPLPATLTSAAC